MIRSIVSKVLLFVLALAIPAFAQTSFYQPANAVFAQCNVIRGTSGDSPQCNAIPVFDRVTPLWSANTSFVAGTEIQIVAQLSGYLSQTYIFYAMTSGTTGATEPQWNNPPYPPSPGEQVRDGSVIWSFVGGDASIGINVGTGVTLIYRGVAICRTDNCSVTSKNTTPSTFNYGFQYKDSAGVEHQADVSGDWSEYKQCYRFCTLKARAFGTVESGN